MGNERLDAWIVKVAGFVSIINGNLDAWIVKVAGFVSMGKKDVIA
jgi:hypothetical protein